MREGGLFVIGIEHQQIEDCRRHVRLLEGIFEECEGNSTKSDHLSCNTEGIGQPILASTDCNYTSTLMTSMLLEFSSFSESKLSHMKIDCSYGKYLFVDVESKNECDKVTSALNSIISLRETDEYHCVMSSASSSLSSTASSSATSTLTSSMTSSVSSSATSTATSSATPA